MQRGKRVSVGLLAAALGLGLLLLLAGAYFYITAKYAAYVDGEFISKSQLKQDVSIHQLLYRTLQVPKSHPQYDEQYAQRQQDQVLRQLIDERLVLKSPEAKEVKNIPQENDFVANFKNWVVQTRYGSEERWQQVLQEHGLSEADVEDYLNRSFVVSRVREVVIADVSVNEEEISDYYERNKERYQESEKVRARHILVSDRTIAEQLLQRLEEGEDFAELARQYSIDTASADNGGDLGWFPRGIMIPEFEEAAFSLAPGSISGIVETGVGYHIIKVEEKSSPKQLPLEAVRDFVKQDLLQEKKDVEWQHYLGSLRQEKRVLIFLH